MKNQNLQNCIYISWTRFNWHAHYQSKTFNAKIYFINNFLSDIRKLKKFFKFIDYLVKSLTTIFIILKIRPELLFIESPPPFASYIAFLYKKLFKKKFVIDAHNGAFEPPMSSVPYWGNILSGADLVIVHNNPLRNFLSKKFKDVKFFTLNDPLPTYKKMEDNNDSFYILVVTTFHGDEPIEIVLEGISEYIKRNPSSKAEFRITGNYNKKINIFNKYNKVNKIIFLGFLDQDSFYQQHSNAIGIISYSVREMVQQYALMEALGAGKPFISNKNLTNTELFGDKMIFTDNDPLSIAEGIEKFLQNREQLINNIEILKRELSLKRKDDLEKIKKHLGL